MRKKIFYNLFLISAMMLSVRSYGQPITVVLRANYSSEVSVYHNEPILFTVSLTNEVAQENSRWNNATERRLNELEQQLKAGNIKQEDYDKEKSRLDATKRNISSVTVGAAGRPWSSLLKWKMINTANGTEVIPNVRVMKNPSAEEIAILNEQGYYTAFFGIDAEDMQKTPAGTYRITVEAEGEKSVSVQMVIKNETMPFVFSNSDETLLRSGQYFWHAGDAAKGMQVVNRLLQKTPNSLEGLSLKGDLEVLSDSYPAALESYNKALKEYYRQNGNGAEPPEYLLAMIEWVKKQ